jgi:hypothetical protein
MAEIEFTRHAKAKLAELRELGFGLEEAQVIETVLHPDKVEPGRREELIAQKRIDDRHVLRVPYVQEGDRIRIITMYPGRRERYE